MNAPSAMRCLRCAQSSTQWLQGAVMGMRQGAVRGCCGASKGDANSPNMVLRYSRVMRDGSAVVVPIFR